MLGCKCWFGFVLHLFKWLFSLYLLAPCFPRADAISSSVANANSLLLITPLEVFSFSCGYALHLVVWNVFIFNMFSACIRLFTSTSKLPFLVFLTVFGLALVDITFSMRKGENLAKHTSSKDSITINLGKSAASFSESDSERFRLFFLFVWRRHICCIFFTGPALLHPPRSPTCVGNKPRG